LKRSTSNKTAAKIKKDSKKVSGKLNKKLAAHVPAHFKVGGMNSEMLKGFTEFMREEGLATFYFKSKEFEIELSFGGTSPSIPFSTPRSVVQKEISSNNQTLISNANTSAGKSADTKIIKSPFVGTFYRAAGPGKPAFVEVGKTVKEGDALCILEAMKLMNEIEAEFRCKILRILVEDGSPVEYGESLFEVEAL